MDTAATWESLPRVHPRVSANFMMKAVHRGRILLVKAQNLSMDGVFVCSDLGQVGDQVPVSLPLPEAEELIISAQITRKTENGVALKFEQLDWDDLCRLARYMHPRLP
jgi:hypothetical protein